MTQKSLSKGRKAPQMERGGAKKGPAANKHGKINKQRKGKFDKPAIGSAAAIRMNKEITRDVNLKNEVEASRRATQSGGTLRLVRPPADTQVEVRGPKPKLVKKLVKKVPGKPNKKESH
mmetsp:Transcript_16925/g.41588  ORF Transcript_16925/g.41588 Transcript_16925/m.41588 type:complete len:119 (-) Transcript_16925:141-497(-)